MKFKFLPSKEFAKAAKQRYLAVFDAHNPVPVPAHSHPRFIFAMKISVGALAVAAIVLGSASVYADTANVPADSPLYALKRLGESVQLAVAPPAAQADLQASLAARRANEVNDLESRKPTSAIISKLSDDVDTAVNASIKAANETNLADGALTNLCTKLFSAITTSSVTMQSVIENNPKTLTHFTDKCEAVSTNASSNGNGGLKNNESQNKSGEGMSAGASSGASGAASAPRSGETPIVTPEQTSAESSATTGEIETPGAAPETTTTPAQLESRIHTYLEEHSLNLASTTDMASATNGTAIIMQTYGSSDGSGRSRGWQ